VIAIESEREFGLSVLQQLDAELKRRGDLFRELSVQDVAGFRRTGHADPMPRVMLIIDEFQEMFVEDDKLAQDAALILDRLVRQGRAFGMHVLVANRPGRLMTMDRAVRGVGEEDMEARRYTGQAGEYVVLGDEPFRRPDQAVDAYARAWALTFYLAQTRKAAFVAYLRGIARKEPLADDSPAERLRDFTDAFGATPAALEEPMLRYLARLRPPAGR
jgi:hypothetical protein